VVYEAARQLRDKLCQLAAFHLEAAREALRVEEGKVYVQGAPHSALSWRELATLAGPSQPLPAGMTAGLWE
jgi:hypothetical protein